MTNQDSKKLVKALLSVGWAVLLPLTLIQIFWSAANPFESSAAVWKWLFQSFVIVTVLVMLILSCILYAHLI
jgi:sterol desaturase/sphingolipid hydroxylase (fatty acid hydroxylase superfamily)